MSAVTSTRAALGKGAGPGLTLYTPLLLVEETGTTILDGGPGTKSDLISWRDVYAFDRLTYSAAIGPISKLHKRIVVLAPYASAGPGQENVTLSASVVNMATGERMPVGIELTGKTQNAMMETARFELQTENLQPGRYLLYVYAEDGVSKALAHAQTSFVISAEGK
jgi:hypothetical protein